MTSIHYYDGASKALKAAGCSSSNKIALLPLECIRLPRLKSAYASMDKKKVFYEVRVFLLMLLGLSSLYLDIVRPLNNPFQ